MLLGAPAPSAQAKDAGIVDELVPAGELAAQAQENAAIHAVDRPSRRG